MFQVATLKEDFSARTREVETLKMSLKSATDQLEAAESLLGKLGGEKGRWQEQVQSLEQELLELPLNTLMSSGFITYLAAAMEVPGGACRATSPSECLKRKMRRLCR